MLIDIVILPPENIREKLGAKIKKEVGDLPNFYVVDNVARIPHLSLWHMMTSKKKLNEATMELERIVKGHRGIKISASGFHATEKFKGCLELPAKDNKDLALLRQSVFEDIHGYKTGPMPGAGAFLKVLTKGKSREIKKYGRPVGFSPHFTMAWLKKEEDAVDVVKKMKDTKLNFLAKEIYICEVDQRWQVKKILKKISF